MLDGEIRQEYAWTLPHFLQQDNDLLANPITDILTRSTNAEFEKTFRIVSLKKIDSKTLNSESWMKLCSV